MARKYSNTSVETTLVNGIDSSQTSIQINDTGGLPATFPYSLVLDFETSTVEVVTVTNLSGGTLTVTRGQDGTAAQSHDAGAVVVHGVTARDLSEPQQHIDATSEVHGLSAGSALVGTTDVQVLTNKTITFDDNTLTDVASVDTAQTLTNKTIAFDDNTLTDVASVDTAQTLTNKTVTFVDNTLTGVASTGTAQTLTNKTIAAANNTLTVNVDDLADVDAATPADGDVLRWDNAESEWASQPLFGQVIAESTATLDSPGFVAETVVMSVTAQLVNGEQYRISANPGFNSETEGDTIRGQIREDNIGGTALDSSMVFIGDNASNSTRKYPCLVESLYTATATGGKTFVLTGEVSPGTGDGFLRAASIRKSYFRVQHWSH